MSRQPCYEFMTTDGLPDAKWNRDADGFVCQRRQNGRSPFPLLLSPKRATRYGCAVQFAGSDDIKAVGWVDQLTGTRPLGLKQPNAFGLFDCSGNIENGALTVWPLWKTGRIKEKNQAGSSPFCHGQKANCLQGASVGPHVFTAVEPGTKNR